nr:TrbC/VirB2 family protein [Luteimonas aquatica]
MIDTSYTMMTRRNAQAARTKALLKALLFMTVAMPLAAMAEGPGSGGTFTDTGERVCGFFTNINTILNMVSIVVVTLAVIICGYQIAFANKRIADVLPILLGGVMIGAAAQIATMLIGDTGSSCETTSGGGMAMVSNLAQMVYA